MRRLVTGEQMKEIDSYAIHTIGIPSMVLMERAALCVADEMGRAFPAASGRELCRAKTAVFCGTGNNGADGAAIARILHLRGCSVFIVTVGDRSRWTPELRSQIAIARNLGIPVRRFEEPGERTDSFDVAVDALFGVGLSREVEGSFREAIRFFDSVRPMFTVAVDIPSGIHSGTGAVLGAAVRADLTVTFGCEKAGTALYPGRGFAGRICVADIGFPPYDRYAGRRYFCYEEKDLAQIPKRRAEAHKGTYGKVLIAAGSEGMCGAAYLSALAAYRMGAGLVKILTVKSNAQALQTLLPEAILTLHSPEEADGEPEVFKELVEQECAWASVIVLGPGLGKGRYVEQLVQHVLLSAYVPIIVDADGLNAVADYPYLADYLTENVIITPHPGEMARLTGQEIAKLREDLAETAVRYSEDHGVTCVLKDAATVTARRDGTVYIGNSGTAAMAKAGSGDVLAGTIAGLIALGFPEDEAASFGVWLHGRAGSCAAKASGEHGLLASETANALLERVF